MPATPASTHLADSADDVQGVAVAGVHVGDEGHVDGAHDVAHALHRLGHGEQADIGGAEGGGREPEAGGEERLEAGLFGEARGEGVVGAGQDDDLGAVEHGAEGGGVVHGASRLWRAGTIPPRAEGRRDHRSRTSGGPAADCAWGRGGLAVGPLEVAVQHRVHVADAALAVVDEQALVGT